MINGYASEHFVMALCSVVFSWLMLGQDGCLLEATLTVLVG